MEGLKRIRWVLIYGIFYMAAFYWVEHRPPVRIHIIHTLYDDYIPFCEYFIVPYYLWFFFVAAAVVYFAFFQKSRQEYYSLILNLGIGMTIFIFFSWIYPNGQVLRPRLEGENIFEQAVMLLYKADTPTNIFPSIHVFNSLACCMAFLKNKACRSRRLLSAGIVILTVSIVLSTVFLKQHSVVDVVGAFAMAAILYPIVYPAKGWNEDRVRSQSTSGVKNRRMENI